MNDDDLDHIRDTSANSNIDVVGYERSRQLQQLLNSRQRAVSTARPGQPAFQIRASNFVKKLGILTSKLGAGARFRSSQDTSDNTTPQDALADAEQLPLRKARSMDVLWSKPYMSTPMLSVAGFDSQVRGRKSSDGSHESGSEPGEVKPTNPRKPSNSNSNSIARGLAVAATVAEAASLRPTSTSSPRPEGLNNSRAPIINASASASNKVNDSAIKKISMKTRVQDAGPLESLAPPPPEKRPGHPRLSTLPPLDFILKGKSQEQRPQRFSPSVIVRPPPFPILELPTLPTPVSETPASGSQAEPGSRRGTARLNSMPMLPREGSDVRDNDPDHDNCVLDEDECDDEDNEEDGTLGDGDAAGSEDEDEIEAGVNGRAISSSSTSPSTSFFSRNRSLPPLMPLPAINTPSLSTLIGNFGGSSSTSNSESQNIGSGTLSANASHVGSTSDSEIAEPIKCSWDEETTPKTARANHVWGLMGNGSAHLDYFSTSGAVSKLDGLGSGQQNIDKTFPRFDVRPPPALSSPSSSSSSSALRTPTARDPPASQTPIMMISVAPPSSSWSRSETTVVSVAETRTIKDAGFVATKGADTHVPHLAPTCVADGQLKRPSIYHHASKSMIELFSTPSAQMKGPADPDEVVSTFGHIASDHGRKGKGKLLPEESEAELHSLKAKEETKTGADPTLLPPGRDRNTKAGQAKALPNTPTTVTSGDAAGSPSPNLRRQRSMPTFSTSGPPPPYPSFPLPEHLRGFIPAPREDEGKEELPPYSNDIRLAAIMPRKMEFSAPGVPSRDRKWRRVHCVLEGTAFRVYDAPPRVTGVSALGGWWERKVGVGDVSSGQSVSTGATAGPGATTNIVIGRKEPRRRMKWEEELQAEEDARRVSESATDEGPGRASTSSSTSTVEVNIGAERERPLKSKRNLAATLLHPNRSRHSLTQGRSPSPASPRSSFQSPRNSVESSTSPSARPSVDLPGTSACSSTSSALSSASSTSASSSSLSALSTNSAASSSSTQTRRRAHLRSDSAQSSISTHSRPNSRAQSPANQDARLQLQSHYSTPNSYLYHNSARSDLPEPDEDDRLRVYSLQNGESGLASDYIKRKNVVRVRLEGEQFLLQCKDVASVVEWIEGFQAASNIALDLDERPMPKGPIFPRRRRRRRVQRTETGSEGPTAATTGSGAGAESNTTS